MASTQTPTQPPGTVAETAWELVLGIDDAAEKFVALDLTRLPDDEVRGLVVAVERAARKVFAVVAQRLLAQVIARGLDLAAGCKNPIGYLCGLLHVNPAEAKSRVVAVERFQPRPQLSGEVLPPAYPQVAAALDAGDISASHGRVIASSLDQLPDAVPVEAVEATEEHLVDYSTDHDPTAVSRRFTRLQASLDPDGLLATEKEQRRRRTLSWVKQPDGMWKLVAILDPEAANVVQNAIEALSKPRRDEDGTPDDRPAGRRRADSFVQISQWSLNQPGMPTHGGRKPQVTATVTLAELEERAGAAWLDNGDPVSVPRLLELLGQRECEAVLAVFGHHGEILHLGRTQRLASDAIRRALEIRDRGCSMEGCGTGPLFCEANHSPKWSEGGQTNVDEMNLYCTCDHKRVDDDTSGWRSVMIHGVPYTIPPNEIDPTQTPRRNRAHDPP